MAYATRKNTLSRLSTTGTSDFMDEDPTHKNIGIQRAELINARYMDIQKHNKYLLWLRIKSILQLTVSREGEVGARDNESDGDTMRYLPLL